MLTAKNYRIYVEDNPLAPTCRMIATECTDILNVVDNRCGRLNSFGRRTAVQGVAVRIGSRRVYQPNTMTLRVAQEDLDYWRDLRDSNCHTCLQIRECPGDGCDWDDADTYIGVAVDNIVLTQQTAQGVNVQDTVRIATVSLEWQDLINITDEPPLLLQANEGFRNNVVGVTFCACGSCCSGLKPCDTIYRLLELGRIEVSYDRGATWEELATCLPCSGSLAIACYAGRLFVSLLAGVFYTSDPSDPDGWIESIGGRGIFRFARSGSMIYGLGEQDGLYQIWRSIDAGRSFILAYETETELTDIAAAGPTVVAVGDSSFMIVSSDTGETWTEKTFNSPIGGKPDLKAVDIVLRDQDDLFCFIAYVSDDDNNIYRGDLETWRRIYNGQELDNLKDTETCYECKSTDCAPAHLFAAGCGQTAWYTREVYGYNVALRNAGDCFTWLQYAELIDNSNCEDIEEDTYVFGCADENGMYTGIFACCSEEIPCELEDYVVFGCQDGEDTYIFRCPDECDDIYISLLEDCANCVDCEDCVDPAACTCDGCVNCIDPDDIFEIDIEDICDEVAFVGFSGEGVLEECSSPIPSCLLCVPTTAAAVCPTDPNVMVSVASSVIGGQCDLGCC